MSYSDPWYEVTEGVDVRMWCAVITTTLEKLDTFIRMYRKHFRLRYVVTKCMMRVYSGYSLFGVLGVYPVCTADSSAYL